VRHIFIYDATGGQRSPSVTVQDFLGGFPQGTAQAEASTTASCVDKKASARLKGESVCLESTPRWRVPLENALNLENAESEMCCEPTSSQICEL